LGGLGLTLAGVPFAGLLTALDVHAVHRAGWAHPRVAGRGGIWALYDGSRAGRLPGGVGRDRGHAGQLDLRPVLIRMGADLPLLLIFAGVIGGLFAFGLVGIFVGPVVLAVAYTLLEAWMDDTARHRPSTATERGRSRVAPVT
jgi:hypothetical protein